MAIEFDENFEKRILSPTSLPEDAEYEGSIRPKTLDEYYGQRKVKENLSVYIEAAKLRGEPLDHVLLYGPPGLGKTSLANIIASELGVNIRTTSGPAVEKQGDLAAFLTTLNPNDVLFIDEIHRLRPNIEEILYPAMEDYAIDMFLGKGPSARALRLDLPRFTLIGATTRSGQLSSPLRDRFGVILRLEMYSVDDLSAIIGRSANILSIEAEYEGILEIARRSRGTPRIANRLLKRVRDFAQVRAGGIITKSVADRALDVMEIDKLGLEIIDRKILENMINIYNGGPVGLEALAASVGEEAITIEEVLEPYLMQIGFINRTPRGRSATALAYRHLGMLPPGQQSFD